MTVVDELVRSPIRRPEMRLRCSDEAAADILSRVVPAANGCWATTTLPNPYDGYVQFRFPGTRSRKSAHRTVWETVVGPIAPGLQLDHLCRNRGCVNPEHLEPVTPLENVRRSSNGVRRGVCKAGHPRTPENTYRRPVGNQPSCKPCLYAENKRRQAVRRPCPDCGRVLASGSIPRHRRDSCPAATFARRETPNETGAET